jgi:Fe-S-cluster containining protein
MCGLCCKLFLINLNKEEYLSGEYETQFQEFNLKDDFGIIEKYGGNILSQKKDGSCIYLKNNLCSIHEKRPQVCRNFDCNSKLKKFKKMIRTITDTKKRPLKGRQSQEKSDLKLVRKV